jgi:hypothetical protein
MWNTGGLLHITLANNEAVNNTGTLVINEDFRKELQVRLAAAC